jgi:type IV secretion system protein VirD4
VVVGGAGSGKSSCIAIPTLNSWEYSFFAIDIKGELSTYYENIENPEKRDYIVFDPTDPNSKGYDPYYLLRNSETEGELIQHVRELALSIIPLTPNSNTDPFWIETPQNILTGGILYYFYMGYGFSQTMDFILSEPVQDLIDDILNSDVKPAHKFVAQIKKLKPETIASFATTLSNHIMVFATDTQIYDVLSKNPDDCFRIDDFDINIFLRLQEDKLEQWKPLIALMNRQRIRASERRPDKTTDEGKELTPSLMLLDEFPRLGKVEDISGALATLRSKGVTIALFIQSLAQLDYIYGEKVRRIILDNCPYKAILNVADPTSQEYFSKLSGTSEVEKKGHSVSYDADSGIETGASDNFHLRHEPMVLPHEFAKLNDVVLMTPNGFCRVNKEPYYWQENRKPPTPPPTKVTDVTDPIIDTGKKIIATVADTPAPKPNEPVLFPESLTPDIWGNIRKFFISKPHPTCAKCNTKLVGAFCTQCGTKAND